MSSIRRLATTLASYTPQQPRKTSFKVIGFRAAGDGFFTGGKDAKIFKVDLAGNPV